MHRNSFSTQLTSIHNFDGPSTACRVEQAKPDNIAENNAATGEDLEERSTMVEQDLKTLAKDDLGVSELEKITANKWNVLETKTGREFDLDFNKMT